MIKNNEKLKKPDFSSRFLEGFCFLLLHIFPKSSFLKKSREKNFQRNLKKNRTHENFNISKVDRVKNISEKDFIRYYFNPGVPLIFDKEAQNWDCVAKWSLEFLKNNYGNVELSDFESAGLNEPEYTKENDKNIREPTEKRKITLRKLIDRIQRGKADYIRFSPFLESQTQLLKDLNHKWLKKMRRCLLGVGIQSFIGAKGRRTPLHSASMAFLYIMVEGKKKWKLVPASSSLLLNPVAKGRVYNFPKIDLKNCPYSHLISRYECELEEGDILFVPAWMWHEVENLSHSWGVSYRYTSLRSFLSSPSFALVRVFFSSPSFFKVLYQNFFSKKKSTIITPKIYFD